MTDDGESLAKGNAYVAPPTITCSPTRRDAEPHSTESSTRAALAYLCSIGGRELRRTGDRCPDRLGRDGATASRHRKKGGVVLARTRRRPSSSAARGGDPTVKVNRVLPLYEIAPALVGLGPEVPREERSRAGRDDDLLRTSRAARLSTTEDKRPNLERRSEADVGLAIETSRNTGAPGDAHEEFPILFDCLITSELLPDRMS